MDWRKSIHRFYFHDYFVIYEKIKAITTIKFYTFIN